VISITVRRDVNVHVVSLSGVADADLARMLLDTVRQLAVEDGPVVVDLTDVTLVRPDAIRAMLQQLSNVGTLRVVSGRATAREILRRCGLGAHALYGTVEEALDALVDAAQSTAGGREAAT